jgi:hypothetical protein
LCTLWLKGCRWLQATGQEQEMITWPTSDHRCHALCQRRRRCVCRALGGRPAWRWLRPSFSRHRTPPRRGTICTCMVNRRRRVGQGCSGLCSAGRPPGMSVQVSASPNRIGVLHVIASNGSQGTPCQLLECRVLSRLQHHSSNILLNSALFVALLSQDIEDILSRHAFRT